MIIHLIRFVISPLDEYHGRGWDKLSQFIVLHLQSECFLAIQRHFVGVFLNRFRMHS